MPSRTKFAISLNCPFCKTYINSDYPEQAKMDMGKHLARWHQCEVESVLHQLAI